MANMENEAFTFAEVTKAATEADQRSRSNTHRINDLAKKQTEKDKLVTAVATMANGIIAALAVITSAIPMPAATV